MISGIDGVLSTLPLLHFLFIGLSLRLASSAQFCYMTDQIIYIVDIENIQRYNKKNSNIMLSNCKIKMY